jgi:heme exporter protein D
MTYLEFVLAAYLVSAMVLVGLIGWVVLDGRAQAKALDELDRAGFRRAGGTTAGESS